MLPLFVSIIALQFAIILPFSVGVLTDSSIAPDGPTSCSVFAGTIYCSVPITTEEPLMNVSHLYCSACGKAYEPRKLYNLCECGKPLMVAYDLEAAARTLTRESLAGREPSLWRYREVLPLDDERNKLTLGEGMTPLLKAERLGANLGLSNLFIKDEGVNPTGSFKARGMAVAISMAKELGVAKLAVPSAGNAAGALAAYAAKACLPAFIFMPLDTPSANIIECQQTGANVTLIDGLITDCGKIIAERKTAEGWFDVSTLKEPYRVEGKKTMGYELAEQFNWELPDVILYPTGGGTGLIGMWKAFDEMEQMGWIGNRRPRMGRMSPCVKGVARARRS